MKRSILPWPSAMAIQTMTLLPLAFLYIPVAQIKPTPYHV